MTSKASSIEMMKAITQTIYSKDEVVKATLEYFDGDELATNVFVTKYALKNKNGEFLERTPDDMHDRLAAEFARIEKKFGGERALTKQQIRDYLDRFEKIVPQGSPMFGIGNNHANVSLSNCVVVASPEDNVSSIIECGKQLANLFKRRCGVGIDISNLRPEGMAVSNSAGTTTGAWSFADFYSYVCRMIGQNGRRGALMISLSVKNPDAEKFVTMKHDRKKVTGANVSLKITDEFMNAVLNDEEFIQQFPVDVPLEQAKLVKKIRARDLWNVIVKSATETAEPGLIMWDNIINNLPAHEYDGFHTISTNPCCFAASSDVFISIRGGEKEIKQITSDDEVWVYSIRDFVKTSGYFVAGKFPTYKVRFSNDEELITTINHKFALLKQDEHSFCREELVELHEIKKNIDKVALDHWDIYSPTYDELIINRDYVTIVSVEPTGLEEEVGCIEVPEHHKFVANEVISGNSELPLSAFDSCRLISINLKHFVKERFTNKARFDSDEFAKIVSVAMRLSDDLVELEIEKLVAIEKLCDTEDEKELWRKLRINAENGRRTGLGTHGLADALACLCLHYDSNDALTVIDEIYTILRNEAYKESVKLAQERGAFSVFDWNTEKDNAFIKRLPEEIKVQIEKYGRRNISLLTSAPTGSVATLSQTSSGIEPVFRNSYTRRRKLSHGETDTRIDFVDELGDKWTEYKVFHHNVTEFMKAFESEIIPYFFVESDTIDWKKRVDLQSVIQKSICHSISSTINLPKGTKSEVVSEIYLRAWQKGLKGITVYVDGSRDGVLLSNESTEVKGKFPHHSAPKRPDVLDCDIHHMKVKNEQWIVFVGLLNDKPYELLGGLADKIELPLKYDKGVLTKRIFKTRNNAYDLTIGKNGEEIKVKDVVQMFDNPNHSALTRLASLSLRHGAKVNYIVEQLQKEKDADMFSFAKCLARVLKTYIQNGDKVSSYFCKECENKSLIYEDGCKRCQVCGWSAC